MPAPQESYAEGSTLDLLYIANGLESVKRWDGRAASPEDAGVPVPSGTLTLSTNGAGTIAGLYKGYCRFIDKYGNYSNLSTISAEFLPEASTGVITTATNASPIAISSTAHGLSTGHVVYIKNVGGNTAANGVWTITVTGVNGFTLNGSTGNGGYTSGGSWHRGTLNVLWQNVPVSSDPNIVRKQLLRNTHGQYTTFYVELDTTDVSTSAFLTNMSDAQLAASTAVPLSDADGTDLAISRYTAPPNDRKVIANMLGRTFAAGDAKYSVGACIVTNGSATVTGIGTEWTSEMAGRYFDIPDAPESYEISSVDDGAQTLTLAENYDGTTDPYALYTIRSASARRRAVDYSEASLPDAWPPTNSIDMEKEAQGDDATGLLRFGSFMFILFKTRVRRLTFESDPSPVTGDGGLYPAGYRGAVNNRVVVIDGNEVRMLDNEGLYDFRGGDGMSISDDIQPLFSQWPNGEFRVHWQFAEHFHAVYDPNTQLCRWFVCLEGSRYPRHAIVYDGLTRRFWIEEYYRPIVCSTLGTMNGQPQVFLGTDASQILALGAGELDGPDPTAGTTYGTPTAVGLMFLTDSTATFSSDIVGAPLHIVDGPGRGQWRRIVSVASGKMVIDRPWLHLPTTESTYQIGGISYRWKSPTFRYAASETSEPRRVMILVKPTENPGIMSLRLYQDRSSTPMDWSRKGVGSSAGDGVKTAAGEAYADLDLTKESGWYQIAFDSPTPRQAERPRFLDVELLGVKGEEPVVVYEAIIDGVER